MGLPQIDVERVSPRGNDEKIVWIFHGDAEQFVDSFAAFAMGSVVVAGDYFGQFAVGSQNDVDEEIRLDQAAGVEEIFVAGISVEDARGAAGLKNHAVIEGGGAPSRDTGNKTLSAAAIACDQVIHDLAGEDDAVS